MRQRVLGFAVVATALVMVGRSTSVRAGFEQQTGTTQGRGQGAGAATATPLPQTGTQTGIRDNTPTQLAAASGTAEISGLVLLEGGSSGPVRHAQVSITAQELRGQRTLLSDERGRFEFTALPAGRYTLTASKPGYVSITFGAKRAGRPGTPIQLVDGQKFQSATMLMPKGSVLTGIVVDEDSEPSPGTQVRAYQYVLRTGQKTLQQKGSATSDDRGMYRIYGLQPGDYLVSATPRNLNLGDVRAAVQAQVAVLLQQAQAASADDPSTARGAGGGRGGGGAGQGAGGRVGGRGQTYADQASLLQQQLAQQEKEQTVAYAPVYYPGTTNSASALAITLAVGEERAGVDFQLVQVQTAIVMGTLIGPDGHVPQGTQVTLRPIVAAGTPAVPGLSEQGARVLADGTFAFSNVAPGQYVVGARATIRETDPTQANQAPARGRGFAGPTGRGGPGIVSAVLWASADVTVNGQNVAGVNLTLTSGMTISGHLDFHGTTLSAPTDLSRVRVTLTSQDTSTQDFTGGLPPASVDTNGNFTMPGIPPGFYQLHANPPLAAGRGGATTTANWVLRSALVNGRDSLDFPFEVKPGSDVGGAVLAFVDHNQTLKGTLSDATGRPTSDYTIIVFASDRNYWTPSSRRISSARPGTDGSYSIGGLPPGDYRITAVTDVEQGEWYDPDFLGNLLNKSIPVSLGDGETKVQDLKLAGG